MSFYLNELEWGLLSQLGRKCGSTKTAPWECLCSISAALGYRVDSAGDLQKASQAGPGKKKRRAGAAAEPAETHPTDTAAPSPSLLVPAEALQADGEAAYLAEFRAETLVDDRQPAAATSLAQAVASNEPDAVLHSLLAPCTPGHFAETVRERGALLVRRPHSPAYNAGVLSADDIWALLKAQPLRYGSNVDVARYTAERRRETFNYNAASAPPDEEEAGEEEVADVRVVRKRYAAGSSVRLLHPQRWSDSVARLLAPLEQLLQCPLGCNAYLTPPSSQGFAPHFDDVDVYVLQVEGRKRWRVYAPLPGHALPRYSSRDFVDAEVGPCVLEAVLQPGDLLYLPRGTIHQAASLPEAPSLHLTLSADHRRAWADLLEATLQEGIDDLRKACFASRMAVPPALYHCAGLLHSNRLAPGPTLPAHTIGASGPPCAASTPNPQLHHLRFPAADCQLSPAQLRGMRAGLAATLDALMVRLAPCLHGGASDRATDTLAAAFVAQRLPPSWLPEPPEDLEGEDPDAEDMAEVRAMRVAAPTLARLVDEADPDCLAVRHCLNNSRTSHAAAAPAAAAGDAEEDVLRLPFFLVPRPCAAAVAAQLLNATPPQQPGAAAAAADAGGGGGAKQRGKKKGGKRKRGGAAAQAAGGTGDGVAAVGAADADEAREGQALDTGLLRWSGPGVGAGAVLEAGSVWQVQVEAGRVGVGEGGVTQEGAMDREEVEETAGEVKWTMARLGLCAR